MEEVGRWRSVAKMSQAELWVVCSCFFPVRLWGQIFLGEQGIQENAMKAKEIHYLWHCMIIFLEVAINCWEKVLMGTL